MVERRGMKMAHSLKLGWLEGGELGRVEGDDVRPELGAAESLGESDGELENPVDRWMR
jgi:hypothetical protein